MKKTSYSLWPRTILTGAIVALSSCGAEKEPHNFTQEPFKPEAGEFVADATAGKYTIKYQKKYGDNNHAVYFNKEKMKQLFEIAGEQCVGVRIYRSVNEAGAIGMIMVGVDKQGNDIADQQGSSGSIVLRTLESYEKCPDNCDEQASLLDNHPNEQ